MKSYIIFYVLWFVFSIVGWIGFIACNLDISVTSQMNIWFNYATGMQIDKENKDELNKLLDDMVDSIDDIISQKAGIVNKEQVQADICPQCLGKLVKRTATRGLYAGNTFWGCGNYPNCKYIRNDD